MNLARIDVLILNEQFAEGAERLFARLGQECPAPRRENPHIVEDRLFEELPEGFEPYVRLDRDLIAAARARLASSEWGPQAHAVIPARPTGSSHPAELLVSCSLDHGQLPQHAAIVPDRDESGHRHIGRGREAPEPNPARPLRPQPHVDVCP